MATETIDIIVRENGSRVVKRNLEQIGEVAKNSVRGLRLLQNSLFVLGGAGAVAGLVNMLDTLTNFRNRLTLVTNGTAELNAVQNELFNIAVRTRTSFEGTAEIFTRTALSVRELGLSQQETLDFTESLNKAIILSGAGVREANAALIQLSQGIASNRLAGDELRSTLEQLPFVADIIAKSVGATRGQLRALAKQGRLTGLVIIKSFQEAREEINLKFAKTVPTIGQAFSVLRTQALRALNSFNTFTGASGAVATAIIRIANSLEFLIAGLLSAAAAFAAVKLGKFITESVEFSTAISRGNAVLLTAVEVENAKAASSLKSAEATLASTTAEVQALAIRKAVLAKNFETIAAEKTLNSIIIENGRARSVMTGMTVSLSKQTAILNALQREQFFTQRALRITTGELTAATALQTEAELALAAAQGRSAAAGVAANSMLAKLTRAFPGLSAVVGTVVRLFGGLLAVIASNPVTAAIAALVAATAALAFFSSRIEVADDGVVSLREIFLASFQLMGEAIAPVANLVQTAFAIALSFTSDLWKRFADDVVFVLTAILNITKVETNRLLGLWLGTINSIARIWDLLPAAFGDVVAILNNMAITFIEIGINGIIRAMGELLDFIGSAAESVGLANPFENLFQNFSVNLDRFRPEITGAAEEVGSIIQEEFGKALSTDFIGDAGAAILDRARQLAQERLADLTKKGPGKAVTEDDGKKTFADFVSDLAIENEILKENRSEREKLSAILAIERQLKRDLTSTEIGLIRPLLDQNELLKRSSEIFDEINDPADKYALTLRALNELLVSGRVSQEQFTDAVRNSRIEFLDSQTDIVSGLERGFLKILESTRDFASQTEEIITNAFDGMTEALTDFIVDGEADFASLIKSIHRQIVKLVVSQAFQALFNSSFGGGGGGSSLGSIISSGIGSLAGFQNGGSFTVGPTTGIASLSGADNRLVAFRAGDGERVSVTKNGGSGEKTVIVEQTLQFNITTGVEQTVRAEIMNLAPQIAEMAASQVAMKSEQGGSFGKVFNR